MIHERGYWLDHDETDLHLCDERLCNEIIRHFPLHTTIIDIGCGNGAYTKMFLDLGYDCKGYDGSPLTPEISDGLCGIKDFSVPVEVGKFDLVLSLEVGEHIPVEYEQVFLDNITRASKKCIVLSWAIEGQSGSGHVNCRNNDYVIEEMKKRGFKFNPSVSNWFREHSELPWFKNTLMTFYK